MSLAYRPLAELIDRALLTQCSEEVSNLSVRILNMRKEVILEIGDQTKVPTPDVQALADMTNDPLPIELPQGRGAGLFVGEEHLGYVIVGLPSPEATGAADFLFNLVHSLMRNQSRQDDLEFSIEHLKNTIGLLQRVARKTVAVLDREKVAKEFVSECELLFGARSGKVVLFDGPKKAPKEIATYGQVLALPTLGVAQLEQGKPWVLGSGAEGEILVAPLMAGKQLLGVLYLGCRETGPFVKSDQQMAETVATILAATLANIGLVESLVRTERIKSTLGRYLSPNLVKELVETGQVQQLGGKRTRAASLFADIRGFTKLSEKISPEQMVLQLNEYFEEMAQVIFKHNGTLDKFIGDMVMVLFGAPKAMPDASMLAVQTAIEMQRRAQALSERWKAQGKVGFPIGIGINVGDIVFGNIGSSQAMGLTAIGESVNQAQRLQSFAKADEILISEAVYREVVAAGIQTTKLGDIEVKGMHLTPYTVNYKL